MGKYGSCNFDGLKDLKRKLEILEKQKAEEFMEACAKELAARLLAKVIKRTPVGQYPYEKRKQECTYIKNNIKIFPLNSDKYKACISCLPYTC